MGQLKEQEKPAESRLSYVKMVSKSIVSRSGDFSKVLEFFDRHAKNLSFVQCVAVKLNVPGGVVLMLLALLMLLFFVSRIGGSIICDSVGFLYPSYKSFKVLRQSDRLKAQGSKLQSSDKASDADSAQAKEELCKDLELNKMQLIYWTKYWVVFSLGFIFNYFANMFLYWIPFFYFGKLLFIVLLLHPKLQGAELIYNLLIAPILHKYESIIDSTVVSIENTADQLTKYGVEKLSGRLRDYATKRALSAE
ncbi:uncharacterized protein TOT_020001019 [Theileria orientalis strain Shintoku]|uniref:HVA22/TB2/DP1 family protein n=1 Tax=Theileria orientalis strain Shintoku TaxID=869250 RepID=J4C340_THEOR|nr:uncharacterized protein TOT_020001019 [Theileria orientalis strain Shintoku]BAM39776.1 uncharacterized protein TOT_020001019 [Theileria orientalis strain Shintoku]|eukprot:XP_009690077.1 uncharacterized protein TOT_020001019 [Theileria orientalis strain Shintoku]